jgi:hypothetical protein
MNPETGEITGNIIMALTKILQFQLRFVSYSLPHIGITFQVHFHHISSMMKVPNGIIAQREKIPRKKTGNYCPMGKIPNKTIITDWDG